MPRTQQAAYDQTAPNGTARRRAPGNAIWVFRLYRKLSAPGLGDAPAGTSVLSPVLNPLRDTLRTARNFLRDDLLGPLQGRVLEREFQFVLIPERIDETPEVRTHFTYVREGYFIDTPLTNAKGITHWRLSGRTQWTPVFVDGVPVDGDAALKEFKELVDDYFFPRDGRVTADFELYWFNFGAPISADDPFGETEWLIHPLRNGVRTFQTAQRPFTRFLSFEFAGLQSNRDKAKAEDGLLGGLLGAGFLATLLHDLGLDSIVAAVTDVFGTIDELKGFLDDVANVVTAATDYVTGVQEFIQISIGKIRGLLTATQTIVGRIQDGIDLVKQLPDIAEDDLQLLQQDFPGLMSSGSPDAGIIAVDLMARLRDVLLALAAQPQSFVSPTSAGEQPQRTVAVSIQPGTTIERIARDAGVSVDVLIQTNNLRYPFVDARPRPDRQRAATEAQLETARARRQELSAALDATRAAATTDTSRSPTEWAADIASLEYQVATASTDVSQLGSALARTAAESATRPAQDGVLYAGDPIRIPQPQRERAPSVVDLHPALTARITALTGELPTEEDRLFGLDLALTDDGNLVWDATRKDLAVERGLAHMANVQVRYVRLPLGALRFAPGVGNFAFADIGKWQGPGTNNLLAYAMWSTLRQDPRIDDIRHLQAETRAGVATLTYDAVLINGLAVPALRVPVP